MTTRHLRCLLHHHHYWVGKQSVQSAQHQEQIKIFSHVSDPAASKQGLCQCCQSLVLSTSWSMVHRSGNAKITSRSSSFYIWDHVPQICLLYNKVASVIKQVTCDRPLAGCLLTCFAQHSQLWETRINLLLYHQYLVPFPPQQLFFYPYNNTEL